MEICGEGGKGKRSGVPPSTFSVGDVCLGIGKLRVLDIGVNALLRFYLNGRGGNYIGGCKIGVMVDACNKEIHENEEGKNDRKGR